MSKKVLYDHTDAVFLDPESCGSSIRASAHVYIEDGKLYAQHFAELKDCSRVIEWEGRGAQGTLNMEKKLTVAIRTLEKLRGAVRDAGRIYLAEKRKREKARRAKSSS